MVSSLTVKLTLAEKLGFRSKNLVLNLQFEKVKPRKFYISDRNLSYTSRYCSRFFKRKARFSKICDKWRNPSIVLVGILKVTFESIEHISRVLQNCRINYSPRYLEILLYFRNLITELKMLVRSLKNIHFNSTIPASRG